MIKWLVHMWVSPEPCDNHYHFFDNRVLPPHVDAELATKEGWWFKPEYIINHMNLNSAMFEPRHNSVFVISGKEAARTLKVCGYGYVGGGLKVIRAEISLDKGKTWEITDLSRPEDEIAAARGTDKHWCWAWWETEVDAHRLMRCEEICCRCVDSNQNMQPNELTWNVMGMLNNCIFRIKVHPFKDASGEAAVWFEHPTSLVPRQVAG
jgi:nitrate reductase (NAD(P)H)